MTEQQRFLHVGVLCPLIFGQSVICNTLTKNKVYASADGFCLFVVIARHKLPIIVAVEEIPTDRKFFQKLRIGGFADIGIPIIFLISGSVVVHRLLERGSDAHIVHY